MLEKNRATLIIITLGILAFLIRFYLAFLPGFKADVDTWFAWALRLNDFSFNHFYSKGIFTDYTPGYLYILYILGFLRNLLFLQDNVFYLLLKMPAIISEVIIGLFVYHQVKKYTSEKIAILAFSTTAFNPIMSNLKHHGKTR